MMNDEEAKNGSKKKSIEKKNEGKHSQPIHSISFAKRSYF